MRTFTWLMLSALLFVGCSTTKIKSSQWTSDDFKGQTTKRILVIAKTDEIALQREFEDKMAIILLDKGIIPLKMNQLFPNIKDKKERTREEIDEIVRLFKEKNIFTVLLVSQKSVEVDIVDSKFSFKNYMNSLEPLSTSAPKSSDLEYEKEAMVTYTLEAALYDLTAPKDDRAMAISTVKAINPKSREKVKKRFLLAIEQLFSIE